MALINGPGDATAAGYMGGMGIQGIIKLIQMLMRKKQLGQAGPLADPMTGNTMAPPQQAGMPGFQMPGRAGLGMTKPMGMPSMEDLRMPMINQARTTKTWGNDLPYGRESAGGDLTSVMLPPGEGANPSNDQMDNLLALLPLLKGLNRGGF